MLTRLWPLGARSLALASPARALPLLRQVHGGPESRFCPAQVYQYDEMDKLVINYTNCLHCKACSIKMPQQYIDWTVPEGGGGPLYNVM